MYVLPAGYEYAVPASERLQTHALGYATTGIGGCSTYGINFVIPLSVLC